MDHAQNQLPRTARNTVSRMPRRTPAPEVGVESRPQAPATAPPFPPSPDIEPPTGFDRLLHAAMGRMTGSISPASLALANLDWAMHLAQSPGKWQRLGEKAIRKAVRLAMYSACVMSGTKTEPCIQPLPQDRRFRSPGWQHWPFNLVQQSFLLNQQWWHNATPIRAGHQESAGGADSDRAGMDHEVLVERGHPVFMISWHNPGPQDGDLGMEDYLRLGSLEALTAVRAIVRGPSSCCARTT